MSFFDLEHIFVIFPPGASGNFVSNLIRNLITNSLTIQQLSASGNAHHDASTSNPLGCNVLYLYPNHQLVTDEEKINFYKEDIERRFSKETLPKVSWTHDFSNISFYKKLFPNSKFLVITTETPREKLTAMILQELKNTLDTHGFVFVDDSDFRGPLINKTAKLLQELSGITDIEFLIKVLEDGRSSKNFYLFAYLTLYRMIMYYDLYNSGYELLDHCVNPAATITGDWSHQITRVVGPRYQDCITDECIKINFSDIIDNQPGRLINKLEQLLNISLAQDQQEYVSNSLTQYLGKQNQETLNDPKKYIGTIKYKAFERIKELKIELGILQ